MPSASWVQSSFLGGEWSKTAQGRIDDPVYDIALNTCLNSLPLEPGAWTRRPGTMFAGTTRNGAAGRVIGFSFAQANPYTIELTDGHMRFREGATLIDTNDSVAVTSISTANPAVMLLASAVTWATGDQGYFVGLDITCPLLQNRVFALTKVNTTHFSLSDPITGASINGTTLGVSGLAAGVTFKRILDVTTPWVSGTWASLRAVLCDLPVAQGTVPGAVMLQAAVAPYVLEVATEPTTTANATFTLNAANFKDGPYLDAFTNGVQANPSAKVGVVTITLSFPTYDATKAYTTGDFVTSSSVNYESLIDQNVGHTPASSASAWAAVSAGLAIGPNGFTGSDIGRLVRLFSEPDLWAVGTTYAAGSVVSYNPSGIPGASQQWSSLTGSNTGNIPGGDTTHWQIVPNAAQWTWGKIVALSNQIDRALAGSVTIGNMGAAGGVEAAFDGIISKSFATSAGANTHGTSPISTGGTPMVQSLSSYIGKNYSGASAQAIAEAIVYPSTDDGIAIGAIQITETRFTGDIVVTHQNYAVESIVLNLRAKSTAPSSASDGTLLGSVTTSSSTAPVTIFSNDTTTTWNYVWIEEIATFSISLVNPTDIAISGDWSIANYISQVAFFNPGGTGTSSGVNVEILGPPLLYTTPIRTWRLGLYSNTTGWPTVGTWHDSRLVLLGVVNNRLDASRSNEPFNFAPTDQFGAVPTNAAIAYLFNSADSNPARWATSDERGILVGTQAGEWLVTATTQNLPLSPTNIQARQVTHYGSQDVEPRRAGGVLVFVQRFARKLLEFFPDVYSGRLTAPNLARDAKHLTKSGIAELAYQSELAPIVWARRGDGTLVGTTYKRENLMGSQGPAFNGWHRHTLGSGRSIESICGGPSTDGNLDTLTMVTNDGTTRHVEVMTNLWEEGSALTDAWHLDDAVAPSSFTANLSTLRLTINGLWHLNGKTVTAFVAGVDAGDYAVTNGTITVPIDGTANSANGTSMLTDDRVRQYLGGTLPAVIGFDYNSDAQVLPAGPQKGSGAALGPAMGEVSRDNAIKVRLVDTIGGMNGTTAAGIKFGSFFDKLRPGVFKTPGQRNYDAVTLFTGTYWAPVENPYNRDEGQLCWRVNRGYPATIAAFGGSGQTQG